MSTVVITDMLFLLVDIGPETRERTEGKRFPDLERGVTMSTVKLKYSAMSNITFHGVIDSGVDWRDWREMDHEQRVEIITDALFELVDIDAEDDPGEE